jgi:hypothetical protein
MSGRRRHLRRHLRRLALWLRLTLVGIQAELRRW